MDQQNRPGWSDSKNGNRPGQSDSEKGNGYNSAGGGGARVFFFFFSGVLPLFLGGGWSGVATGYQHSLNLIRDM
jgi:hypothetical protein